MSAALLVVYNFGHKKIFDVKGFQAAFTLAVRVVQYQKN